MATTNDQSPFVSLDDDETNGVTHTAETLKLLALTEPVTALKFITSSLQNGGTQSEDDPELGDSLESLAQSDENEFLGITIKLVNQQGGGEGGGEYVERVYALQEGSNALAFVRQTGSYYSNDGIYWDDELGQVFQHQVVVTKYKDYP